MSTSISRPSLSPTPSGPTIAPDQFLSARAKNARKADHIRRPSQNSTPTLDVVPEDGALRRDAGGPPSSYRPISPYGPSAMRKGKGREVLNAQTGPGASQAENVKRKRGEWMLDFKETGRGAQRWAEKERVILAVGSPTAEALAPFLYNPSFSNTLLLVGTTDPLPSVEALTSPSYLLHTSPERTVYPTLQPFNLSETISKGPTGIPAIIERATSLAQQYRRTASSIPRPSPRRDSDDSGFSITPPRTPPHHSLLAPEYPELGSGRSSDSVNSESRIQSGLEPPSRPKMHKSASETSFSRLSTKSRFSALSGKDGVFSAMSARTKSDTKAWNGGSPIDVVINFIPPASDFQPQRAMQEMLHQAVVLTTGIIPVLTRRSTKAAQIDPLPVSLLHVLPNQVPGPLPGVVENFLVGLLPKFAAVDEREIWSSVITLPALLAEPRQVGNESYTGGEVLVFGGVRSLSQVSDSKPRAFLPNWGVCTVAPGCIATYKPRRPAAVSLRSEPHVMGHTSVDARTSMTGSTDKTSSPGGAYHPRVIYRGERPVPRGESPGAALLPPPAPSTPELDPSVSSCSSMSQIGEMSGQGSEESHGSSKLRIETGKKKGIAGWFKSKGKK